MVETSELWKYRRQGLTYGQIAIKTGMSGQAIRQRLCVPRKRTFISKIQRSDVRKWFRDNVGENYVTLARKVYPEAKNKKGEHRLRNHLIGNIKQLHPDELTALSKVTGLPF